ncbi:hypothetical protein [Octadecabacter antarcticus]|uniref:hypothetical protein n=1 Tax=Octadecabacter antarcticus TaxID=1217908 RepID=UPI000313196E|nr:hypothetical protein [Octadecabacter antarcticus]
MLAELKRKLDQAKTLGEAYTKYQDVLARLNSSPGTVVGYAMKWRVCLSMHVSKPLRRVEVLRGGNTNATVLHT